MFESGYDILTYGVFIKMPEHNEIQFIQVEPTTRCNFSCKFCAGRHLPQRDITPGTFQTILETFESIRFLELQGEGEPLLHNNFFDLSRRAYKKDIEVSTITNGSLLTELNIEKLLRSGIKSVFISIEAPEPDTFRQLRGGDFNAIVSNIRLLTEMKKAKKLTRPRVGLAVTILKSSIDWIDDIFILYRELGLDGGFIFQPLQTKPSYAEYYPKVLEKEIISSRDLRQLEMKMQTDRQVFY